MVGKTKELVLSMLVLSLEKIEKNESPGIMDQTTGATVGRIEAKIIPDNPNDAARRYRAIINFGVGKILIEIEKKYFHLQLKEGDSIRVVGRGDLVSIE